MINIISYKDTIESFYKLLLTTQDEITNINLSEDKWSLCEIIGHLVDSASNNHQRFVRLQFGELLDFPAYDTEPWVSTQKYNTMDWDRLITLWYSYNGLLLHIIENIEEAKYKNVWVNGQAYITLEELIYDYYRHLNLHIEHFNKRMGELEG